MCPGYGMTMIIDPSGHVISSVPRDEEGICYGELDLTAVIGGKFLSDPAGHYSNQSLRLIVDQDSPCTCNRCRKSPGIYDDI